MKKVLIYQNRKSDAYVWDVSTPKLKEKAFWSLFKLLDKDWKVYSDFEDEAGHVEWYKYAKEGNYESLLCLLEARQDYEYQEWYITNVQE